MPLLVTPTYLKSLDIFVERDGSKAMTGNLDLGSQKIVSLADPTSSQDGATKAYVDAQVSGSGAVLADGSVPLTANWDVGAFEVRALTFQSDVTTGTAPFTIASTTVVANLNVDKLDGTDVNDAGSSTSDLWTASKIASYVSAQIDGRDFKDSVRAASTANVTLATDVENGDSLDGVTLATNDRILLKNQSTATENGIYVVQASGAPTRSDDMATGSRAAGAYVAVEEGSTNADTFWLCTSNSSADVVNTDNLSWATGGSGESNTASNVGAGVSVFSAKNGVDLEFHGIVAADSKITVSLVSEDVTIGLGTVNVSDLTDVTIASIASGELLQWNGSAWVNNTLAEAGISATGHTHTLDSGSNVTITSNSSGEILKWSGAAWVNNTLAEANISAIGHTHALADLLDVSGTTGGGSTVVLSVSPTLASATFTTPTISGTGFSNANHTHAGSTSGGLIVQSTTTTRGAVEKATTAEMEAETADKYPDAVLVRHHPGVAKLWVQFDGTGTPAIDDSWNVDSITDLGTGNWNVVITDDFINAFYSAIVTCSTNATNTVCVPHVQTTAVGSITILLVAGTDTFAATDRDSICVAAFGEQ